jgi:hypothetical protein
LGYDLDRWMEALAIQKRYGEGARLQVEERIRIFSLNGDAEQIEYWYDIIYRLDQNDSSKLADFNRWISQILSVRCVFLLAGKVYMPFRKRSISRGVHGKFHMAR